MRNLVIVNGKNHKLQLVHNIIREHTRECSVSFVKLHVTYAHVGCIARVCTSHASTNLSPGFSIRPK